VTGRAAAETRVLTKRRLEQPDRHTETLLILNCLRGAHTCARPLFLCCDLNINLKPEDDVESLKMYFYTENEFARLSHSKLLTVNEISMAYEKNTKL